MYFTGIIHANHGGNITDYLLNQVKDATSDVSTSFMISQQTLQVLKLWPCTAVSQQCRPNFK